MIYIWTDRKAWLQFIKSDRIYLQFYEKRINRKEGKAQSCPCDCDIITCPYNC